ncbi:MAG: transglutaminase-like domain-containing protein [Planctomycetota bacterium]|jgi:hypothetical protein|nr:transglutaminase-like domain-containing protein [Planctomycetota bacterium]
MPQLLLLLLLTLPIAAATPTVPALQPGPDDVVEHDDWLHGFLDGQPLANMHVVTALHKDGTRTTLSQSSVLLKRSLLGTAVQFSVEETNLYQESAEGFLTTFQLSQEENGVRTTAVGAVMDDHVAVTVHRPTGAKATDIPLPEGVRLMGMEASQRAMAQEAMELGEHKDFHVMGLMSGQVHLMQMRATLLSRDDAGVGTYKMVLDRVPFMPMQAQVAPDGDIRELTMRFGPMNMQFLPADGPQPLKGAELAMVGLVKTKGPPPAAGERNRYRLPAKALAQLPRDGFQGVVDELLVARTKAEPEALADEQQYLKEETNLETTAPELTEWVAGILKDAPKNEVERATLLTNAVRGHLNGDLSRGEASALEAFRTQKGDCTEHANLLTAALRIAGIPARVDVGFVYAGIFGGWGGHAWVAAYDREGGHWIHLDAAYPGVPRSCYIRTGSASNAEEGGTNAMLDRGMGLVFGETIEVVP